jgi:3-hydroxybutyryl-CoA dehydrogenase
VEPEPVAVIGAGLMGHGIAQVFAVAGHPVRIYDERHEALPTVQARVRANLERIGASTAPADTIQPAASLEDAVAGAAFVTEAVAEDLSVKQALLARLDQLAPDAVLATNTSVMSITAIAERASNRARIVGTHWWNPPHLVPLVEVTPGDETSPETVERAVSLLEQAGKTAVRVKKDVPGFIGNRMQHALWREAIAIVDEGIAEPEDVDRVVKSSFGLRLPVLGPIENADLVGLDLTKAIHDYLLPHLDARPGPAPLLDALVARGDLGMKAGRGFRQWTDEQADRVRNQLFDHLVSVTGGP